jgi:hypothetical protein
LRTIGTLRKEKEKLLILVFLVVIKYINDGLYN